MKKGKVQGLFDVYPEEVYVFSHFWCCFEEVSDRVLNVFRLRDVSSDDDYICAFLKGLSCGFRCYSACYGDQEFFVFEGLSDFWDDF